MCPMDDKDEAANATTDVIANGHGNSTLATSATSASSAQVSLQRSSCGDKVDLIRESPETFQVTQQVNGSGAKTGDQLVTQKVTSSNETTEAGGGATAVGASSGQPRGCFKRFRNHVSYLEFVVFIHSASSFLAHIILQDLLLEKACRVNLGFSGSICDALKARNTSVYKDEETEVQKLVSSINIWRTIIDNVFPPICILFLGAWSDIYGRKFPVLLVLFGYLVRYVGLLLSVYFKWWNAETAALISSLPISLTGRGAALSMALYSYITDTTTIEDRTLRMGIATALRIGAKSLGSAVGGFLTRRGVGFYGFFGIAGGIDLVAFLYTVFFIRNTRKGMVVVRANAKKTDILKDIFNLKNISESARAFFKRRDGNLRFQLVTLAVVIFCTEFPLQGEETVLYLYARYKLDWDNGNYGYFGTFRMLTGFVGGIVSTGILSRVLKISDAFIGIVSCCSQIAGSVIYAIATSSWMMYLAPLVDILNGTMTICARSMISKIIPIDEIGKVNAFIGVIDSVSQLPAGPIYSAVYRATLDKFIGAVFMLSIGFTVPALVIFAMNWATRVRKIQSGSQQAEHNHMH